MLLSLSHAYLHASSKSPHPPSPSIPKPSLRYQNPKPPKPRLRTFRPPPTTTSSDETLAESAIQRISEKLRSLGYLEEDPSRAADRPPTGVGSAGEIFVPTPHEIPKHRVGYTIDSSWSTPENPVPEPGWGPAISRFRELWRKEKERPVAAPEVGVPTVAELTILPEELKRLRSVGIRLEKRLKVGKAGITEGIVNGIHERWRRSELVKIKCEDLCRMNMKRTHEILERKTGGLVVWRSGSIIILYRGANYKYPYFTAGDQMNSDFDKISVRSITDDGDSVEEGSALSTAAENSCASSSNTSARPSLVIGVGSPNTVRLQLSGEVQLEEEANRLLDGLGPRFSDWWGYDPLPVDADFLPALVPGFRKPFRLLPFGVKPKLTDREMTILRRLSRPLPCHFALGKNRNLQGLAVSMIKLWEKCEVAKIAIKRGAQNTNSEIMVEELKHLTGGTLLSRDKEFIVFYRGKDFLPSAVSIAIEERRNSGIGNQKQGTDGKSPVTTTPASEATFRRPPMNELQQATDRRSLATERKLLPSNLAIKRVEAKISQALEKKEEAEKLLAELEKSAVPAAKEPDKEAISEEERYMLRKIGLRMKPFLLLGRRGVFAGTVENMHLHWKYRELVKIISKDRCIKNVESAAQTLEAESGGILVAVERVSKGHAIIVYRGKNYRRPAELRPRTLMNKKEALKRSLEAQRCESLKLHILSLSRNINRLENQMARDYSTSDTMQLTECENSNTKNETDQSGSTGRDNDFAEFAYGQEIDEEVNEANAELSHSNEHECIPSGMEEICNMSNNDNGMSSSHEDEIITNEVVQYSLISTNGTHKYNHEANCTSNELVIHPEAMYSTTGTSSHLSDDKLAGLSFEATRGKGDPSSHEDKLEGESDVEIPFRAAPLSNQERLTLRKQALKMQKRPVLAVGRNNVITGVAKTIKTHFQKYPLAIVNIKGRAEGTSVQEVIFELEQATGAVLVSREPNKVILYRGWGEGEAPRGGLVNEKDAGKGSKGFIKEESVSPKLMEAIRRECGLPNS